MTAASAEIPDSFEVSSFIVHKLKDGHKVPSEHRHDKYTSEKEEHAEWVNEVQEHLLHNAESSYTDTSHHAHDAHDAHDSHATGEHEYSADDRGWYWTTEKESPKDESASHFKSESDRFADLHDRLSVMAHQLNLLFHDLSTFKKETEIRHDGLLHYMKPLYDYAEYSKHQMETLSKDVHSIRGDIEGQDHRAHLEQLHATVHEGYFSLANGMFPFPIPLDNTLHT
jgi:lectin, mannose-binding 1